MSFVLCFRNSSVWPLSLLAFKQCCIALPLPRKNNPDSSGFSYVYFHEVDVWLNCVYYCDASRVGACTADESTNSNYKQWQCIANFTHVLTICASFSNIKVSTFAVEQCDVSQTQYYFILNYRENPVCTTHTAILWFKLIFQCYRKSRRYFLNFQMAMFLIS